MGFAESLKKRKTTEPAQETAPSPQPPLERTEEAVRMETDNQDPGKEQKKNKKRIKTVAKKKTPGEESFEPLVPETRIVISALEEATLFNIQSTEEKFHADLDRDLSEIKAEARNAVPMVRKIYSTKVNKKKKVIPILTQKFSM